MTHTESRWPGRPRSWRRTWSSTAIRVALLAALVAGCGVSDLLPSPQPTFDADPAVGWAWHDSPADHRDAIGQQFDYVCPPNGGLRDIWGTGIYSDDSSVCTAAVHMGMLTREVGGRVRIVIRPGQEAYTGSIQHGIVSSDTGPWDGSFSVVGTCQGDVCAPSP
jgi:hypothetical protein